MNINENNYRGESCCDKSAEIKKSRLVNFFQRNRHYIEGLVVPTSSVKHNHGKHYQN